MWLPTKTAQSAPQRGCITALKAIALVGLLTGSRVVLLATQVRDQSSQYPLATLKGSERDDDLTGRPGDDVTDGGRGNDIITGGHGDDTILFGRGDGQDVLIPTEDNRTLNVTNSLHFKSGIAPSDVRLVRTFANDLLITLNGSTDSITVRDFSLAVNRESTTPLHQVKFADSASIVWNLAELSETLGMPEMPEMPKMLLEDRITGLLPSDVEGDSSSNIIKGTQGNDRLYGGAGDDTIDGGDGKDSIDGGQGNDIITGGIGHDTILFGRGDGQDILIPTKDSGTLNVTNSLHFKSGIAPSDVTLVHTFANDLLITLNGSTDSITVRDFFVAVNREETTPLHLVKFADSSRTVWDLDKLSEAPREDGVTCP